MKTLILISMISLTSFSGQSQDPQQVSKNGMSASWTFQDDRIHFKLQAPSQGWLLVGFNDGTSLTNAYLLMGRVVDGHAEVVEHFTRAPGDYVSIQELGAVPQVEDIEGREEDDMTYVSFSLPIEAMSKYQRELTPGQEYEIILAYSRSDDFMHHSIMRTSVRKKL